MLLGITFRIATAPPRATRPDFADGRDATPRRRRPADASSRDEDCGHERRRAPREAQSLGFIAAAELPTPARAVAAARAFAAGNGYLTGLIVDRFA